MNAERVYVGEYRPFVIHDGAGRILQAGKQAPGFTLDRIDQGELLAFDETGLPMEEVLDTCFVEDGSVRPRPTFTPEPDTLEPAPRQEVVIRGVPACTVRFTGPRSGTQEHDGAEELHIGWTTPGAYTLTFETWPEMPATLNLNVRTAQ